MHQYSKSRNGPVSVCLTQPPPITRFWGGGLPAPHSPATGSCRAPNSRSRKWPCLSASYEGLVALLGDPPCWIDFAIPPPNPHLPTAFTSEAKEKAPGSLGPQFLAVFSTPVSTHNSAGSVDPYPRGKASKIFPWSGRLGALPPTPLPPIPEGAGAISLRPWRGEQCSVEGPELGPKLVSAS